MRSTVETLTFRRSRTRGRRLWRREVVQRFVSALYQPRGMREQRLDELLPTLHTGDLVLFSGCGKVGRGIRFLTGSYLSHVGMVARDPDHGHLPVREVIGFSNAPWRGGR